MAKFYGIVGYGETVEVDPENRPGVYEEVFTERNYTGDVLKNTRRLETGESINDNVVPNNLFSIVSDSYANEHIFAIRYLKWKGTLWKVTNVEVQAPRLLLTIGGVYHGPTDWPTHQAV